MGGVEGRRRVMGVRDGGEIGGAWVRHMHGSQSEGMSESSKRSEEGV
jgi:hypothetical protein